MAEESPVKRQLRDGVEADPENGPSESKKPRMEENPAAPGHSGEEASETQEPRDPGKKQ